ncbi:MAG: Na/Pi symporter [Paraprevotella sp.]|nr:Na/Pi symporter [Paraprevotella sp.]
MGENLLKMAGDQLRRILDSLTTNRFTSLLTGALVAAVIQSSTAASLLTVSFVHAGMLTLFQALPFLMGASVGNTLIAWVMAAEFNFGISHYIYPLMLVAFLLVCRRKCRPVGECIFGLCFILLGLGLLCHLMDDRELAGPDGLIRCLTIAHENYAYYVLLLLIGAAVTFAVQSSAALMATSMVLCSMGIWSIYSGGAFVLGENIGRAVIVCRAASSAGILARRTAFGQLIFNVGGVVWIFLLFPHLVNLLCDFIHFGPTVKRGTADQNMAYVLAAFHTGFNLCNAALFIGLVKPLERLATKRVNKSRHRDETESELRFITKGLLDTPEESLTEARKEIVNYADTAMKMFTQTRYLFSVYNDTEFKNISTLVEHYEDICDEMEVEIAYYLNKISEKELPEDMKRSICGMLREVAEIESIGDSCHHIAHTARRNYHSTQQLTEKQLEHIHQMFQLTEQALEQMKMLLYARKTPKESSTTYYIENEINKFRNQLRNLNFEDVNNGIYSYQTGAMYMDVINECEQLSDSILNVTEARMETSHEA